VRPYLFSPGRDARKDAALLLAYFGESSDVARLEAIYRSDPDEELRWIGAIVVRETGRRTADSLKRCLLL
jgi:hypothetical protein